MEEPRSYEGGCHCGAVRYRLRTRSRVMFECNCSICKMKGYLHLIVPRGDFELLAEQASLTDYQFNTRTAHHYFCKTCGVPSFYVPRSHPDGYSVNGRCLDGHALADFTLRSFNGEHWEANVHEIR